MLLCSSVIYSKFYTSPSIPPTPQNDKTPIRKHSSFLCGRSFPRLQLPSLSFPSPSPIHPLHLLIRVLQHLSTWKNKTTLSFYKHDERLSCIRLNGIGIQAGENSKFCSLIISPLMIMTFKPFSCETGWVFSECWQRKCASIYRVFP